MKTTLEAMETQRPVSPLVLRRLKGGVTIVEPYGWIVTGVIAPLSYGWFQPPHGLICSPSGLLLTKRSWRGFAIAGLTAAFGGRPSIDADDALAFSATMRDPMAVFPRRDIETITMFSRWSKNEIRLRRRCGRVERLFILARAATTEYRTVLRNALPDLYSEEGFDDRFAWLKV